MRVAVASLALAVGSCHNKDSGAGEQPSAVASASASADKEHALRAERAPESSDGSVSAGPDHVILRLVTEKAVVQNEDGTIAKEEFAFCMTVKDGKGNEYQPVSAKNSANETHCAYRVPPSASGFTYGEQPLVVTDAAALSTRPRWCADYGKTMAPVFARMSEQSEILTASEQAELPSALRTFVDFLGSEAVKAATAPAGADEAFRAKHAALLATINGFRTSLGGFEKAVQRRSLPAIKTANDTMLSKNLEFLRAVAAVRKTCPGMVPGGDELVFPKFKFQ